MPPMESSNLETAAKYVNNLLLARGLLKNGKPINFMQPDDGESTWARIINLINDLVVRRDREAEHRENLAVTIQKLRTTESQQTAEIEKLKSKNAELSRALALAEGQQRAVETDLRDAEATIKQLKEQVQKLKTTVQQVRAQCANDIRKRDVEIQKLKSHLNERQRGKREGLAVTTININPAAERPTKSRSAPDVNDPSYSLKQETTEFLTELCQNLSDENDSLISLARTTILTLRELQGLSETENGDPATSGACMNLQTASGPIQSVPTSVEDLSREMDVVLDHLRSLLTNPSFVPLEEVEIRDQQIERLREGWERMEERWKQVVAMMDNWHRRMCDGGGGINVDELRKGMALDSGLGASMAPIAERSPTPTDSKGNRDELVNVADEDEDEENQGRAKLLKPNPPKKAIKALGERHSNVATQSSTRKVSFYEEPAAPKQDDSDDHNDENETELVKAHAAKTVTQRTTRRKSGSRVSRQDKIAEKLARVEAEAQAAIRRNLQQTRKRTRASLKAENGSEGTRASSKTGAGGDGTTRRSTRRRSTLTNEELGALMGQ